METTGEQNLRRIFAKRLQIERRERGLTQEQLAEKIGRSVDLVSRLERATTGPSVETLALLSEVFDLEAASLLTFMMLEAQPPAGQLSDIITLLLSFPDSELPRLKRVIEAMR